MVGRATINEGKEGLACDLITNPYFKKKYFQNEDLPEDRFLGGSEPDQTESAFGSPENVADQANAQPRPLQSFQKSLAERVRQAIPGQAKTKPQSSPSATISQKATQEATKRLSSTLVKLGGKTAASLVGGPAAWAATALSSIKDAWGFLKQHPNLLYALSVVFVLASLPLIGLILSTVSIGSRLNLLPGPSEVGAKPLKVLTDPFEAALASGDKGLTAVSSLSKMKQNREQLQSILQSNPTHLSQGDITKATTILQQMADLEAKIRSSASGANSTIPADALTQYRKLQADLYAVVVPNSAEARSQVAALMASGAVRTNNFCPGTDRDLKSGPLTPTLLSTVAQMGKFAAANGGSIMISCAKSGHRPGTYHELGQAVDIQADAQDPIVQKLLPYIFDNRDQLKIGEIIFNTPVNGQRAGYYDFKKSAGGQVLYERQLYAEGHRTHIHIGVLE